MAAAAPPPTYDAATTGDAAFTLPEVLALPETMPVTWVFVVDGSGSMDLACEMAGAETNLRRWQVVEHSVRAALRTMPPTDRVTIVVYSNTAGTVCHDATPVEADAAFKPVGAAMFVHERPLEGLPRREGTNIQAGLDLAHKLHADTTANLHVVLLTDGDQNRGDAWRSPMVTGKPPTATLHTLAFGMSESARSKSTDPELLYRLSAAGGGVFNFIPDLGMAATVFSNLLCYARTGGAPNPADQPLAKLLSQHIVGGTTQARFRQALDALAIDNAAIEQDIETELMLAVDPAQLNRWGAAYALAYASHLERGHPANFKDKGWTRFETPEYTARYGAYSAAFDALEPPKAIVVDGYTGAQSLSAASAVMSMSAFNSAGNPCVSGDTYFKAVRDAAEPGNFLHELTMASELKIGDHVLDGNGGTVTITHIVKTERDPTEPIKMVRLGTGFRRLEITPWHPVLFDMRHRSGQPQKLWRFPNDLGDAENMLGFSAIYSFAVKPNGTATTMAANGYGVATLAHEHTDNDVIEHPFLGTAACLEGLSTTETTVVKGVTRDPATGLVNGWAF